MVVLGSIFNRFGVDFHNMLVISYIYVNFQLFFHLFELLHLLRLPAYSGCLSKPFALPYLGIRRSAQAVGLIGNWLTDGEAPL